jgi:hypothetical protein
VFRSKGEKSLARAATVAALVAALAIPAVAGAVASTHFEGKFATSGDVSFKLKRSKGERKVSLWSWDQFPLMCAGKPRETHGYFARKDLPVKHREFAGRAVYRAPNGRVLGKAKVDGEFEKGFARASGLFKVTGETPEGDHDCDSGLIAWNASESATPVR